MQRLKDALPGLAISVLAGAMASYFFDLNFWVAASIAAASLMVNGLIAEWEDRGNFND